jgi:hypothetical protein
MIVLGERAEPEGQNHSRPVSPGRPACPIKIVPRLPSSTCKHPSPSSVRVLKFLCLEPP